MSAQELQQFDRDAFLAQYWQRKPLLIRNAIASFTSPLSADELAGLALEDSIESRIIEHRAGQWQLHHGPFTPEDFKRDNKWTVLVQAVDHVIPEVARLRKLFDFLPQWRLDDVMVSYAVDGGSTGPHYDNYDVFLLQGDGERRWQLGQRCDARSPLLAHDELRILKNFEGQQEYVLGPGDILYIPPGIAHWGVAQGECTTFSIGFRAPRINDMLSRRADHLLEHLDPEMFYNDREIEPVTRAGEIRSQDLARVRAQLDAVMAKATDSQWFGAMVTEPDEDYTPDDNELAEARAMLAKGPDLVALLPGARMAWQQESGGIIVFVNGETQMFSETVLEYLVTLCDNWRLEGKSLARALTQAETASLLHYLLATGGIYVE